MVHLCGIALLFYLGLNHVQHDDLELSLIGLRSQHAGADERRNFQLNFRKIDPMKDYAHDFFTDQQKSAELSYEDVPETKGIAVIDR